MADVYGGCEFVLSALSSSQTTDSILCDRKMRPAALGTVDVNYGTWQDFIQLFARKKPRSIIEEIERCPLSRRAWPLQEKMLAPAVLHYGRDQIMWECNDRRMQSETGAFSTSSAATSPLDPCVVNMNSTISDSWNLVLEEFTRRRITHANDRLLALSGIASRIRQGGIRGGRYVAGLWETNLDSQLLWRIARYNFFDARKQREPRNWHISTWSWAHTNYPVEILRSNSRFSSALSQSARFYFKDQDADRTSQSETTVESCAIILRGFVQTTYRTAIDMDSHPDDRSEYVAWEGLPGDNSFWSLDRNLPSEDRLLCVRVLEGTFTHRKNSVASNYSKTFHYLLLHEDNSPATQGMRHLGAVCTRLGVLCLNDVPSELYANPHSDVLCRNGKPLLTSGEWKDIVLI
ncbi:MAG: hypothetical protein M1822_007548 [Bathelium mastoideum]|nr:MAG: hypothetical protein M1822_007548 [Bathelium mastoideum]